MSAKHTPGPWSVELDDTDPFGACEIYGAGDEYLLTISNPHDDAELAAQHEPELAANARLIAAAPDMLAALKAMVSMYVKLVESGDAGFWNAEEVPEVIASRAAISKAEAKP